MSRTFTRISALAVLGATCALAACGSDEDSSGSDSPTGSDAPTADGSAPSGGDVPTSDELSNRAFESTTVTGHELVEGTSIRLLFEADLVSANAGCNQMSGGYALEGDVLSVNGLASTMMACDDALMDQDTWVNEFLMGLPTIAYDGSTLTLEGADATVVFAEVQDAPIEGTTWVVTGIHSGEAVSSVPADAEATLTITDGTANVNAGCNTGSGTVEVTETDLTFGPMATTRKACADDVMELETAVLTTLSGTVGYEIHGESLILTAESGDGLQLTAQS